MDDFSVKESLNIIIPVDDTSAYQMSDKRWKSRVVHSMKIAELFVCVFPLTQDANDYFEVGDGVCLLSP